MEIASLTIAIDSRQTKTAKEWLDHLTASGQRTEKAMGGVGAGSRQAASGNDAATASSRKTSAALREQDNAAAAVTATVRRYASIMVGAFGVGSMMQVADAWGQVNSRLRIAVGTGQQFNTVQAELMRVANLTYSSYDQLASGFANSTSNLSQLGLTMRDQLRVQEALLSSSIVSGANDEMRTRAQQAFNNALAQGVLRGDEWNTISQTSARTVGLLAAELGKTELEVSQLARNGGIAIDTLLKALINGAQTVSQEVENMPVSFQDAGVRLRNAFMQYIGVFDDTNKVSKSLTDQIELLAENFDKAADFALGFATIAIPAVTRSIIALTAAMAKNPFGLIAVAAASAAGYLFAFREEIDEVSHTTTVMGELWGEVYSDIKGAIDTVIGTVDDLHGGVNEMATDGILQEWINAAIVGLARIADVAVTAARAVYAIAGSFEVVGADIDVFIAKTLRNIENLNPASIFSGERYERLLAEEQAALAKRDAVIEDATKRWTDLWEGAGNKFEQIALKSVNTAHVSMRGIKDAFDTPLSGDFWDSFDNAPSKIIKTTSAVNGAAKAAKQFEQERQRHIRSQYQEISNLSDQADALEDQVRYYGLSESALNDLTIARLREQQAALTGIEGAEEEIAIRERMIEQYQRIGLAMQGLEQKEAEKAAWESWSRDVEQIFQQVGQSLTDAIFEGGKSGRDLVKDLFKTLTLRVLINPVMNSIQGAVTNSLGGMFGLQNPQQGGVMGTVSNLGSAYNAASGGLTGNISNVANWVGEKAGSTALQSFASGLSATFGFSAPVAATGGVASLAGVTAGPGLAASLGTGASGVIGGSAAGIGSAIGAALPWVGGALAIGSLLGGSLFGDDEPKTRHGQRTTIDYAGGSFGISAIDDRQAPGSEQAALAAAQAAVTQANEMFARLGVDAAIESFYAVMESSVLGDRQGVASGGMLRTGGDLRQIGVRQSSDMTFAGFGGWSEADMLPRLQTDIQLSILEAFQTQVDSLPDALADMIRGVDVRALDAAGAQDLAARFSAVVEGASSFLQLVQTMPFDQLRDLSFDAAAGLVEVAGGLQNLTGNLNTYYENFHTEAERNANTLRNVAKALEEVGVALPDTRQQFRALVEAQDLTTDAGRRVYAALLNVSGAFASVTQSAEQTAQESQRIAEQNRQTLIGNLESAYSAVVSAGQAEIARLQQSFGATDSAMNSYRSAVQALESEFGSLFTSIDRYISDLRGNVEASAQAQYRQARAVISTALATGQLPQTADLTEALQVAQRGVTSQVYGSLFEQNRAYAILANEMEALKGIAEPELDAARATLAQLEEQYRLLRGMSDLSEGSLLALEEQTRLALSAEESARHQISVIEAQLEVAREQYGQFVQLNDVLTDLPNALAELALAISKLELLGGAPSQSWKGSATAYLAGNPDVLQSYLQGDGGDMTAEQYARYHWEQYGQFEGRGSTGSSASVPAWQTYLANNPDVADSFLDAGQRGGLSAQEYAEYHYSRYGKNEGRSFDVGTAFVPQDMTANIHRGEIIIDPRSSDILRRYGIGVQGGGSDRETVQLLREQLAESRQQTRHFYEILKNVKRTANNTEDTANAVGAHSPSEGAVVVY